LGAALTLAAASIAWRFGIAGERKPLAEVCWPLAFLDCRKRIFPSLRSSPESITAPSQVTMNKP
jgi:hypothetical protein